MTETADIQRSVGTFFQQRRAKATSTAIRVGNDPTKAATPLVLTDSARVGTADDTETALLLGSDTIDFRARRAENIQRAPAGSDVLVLRPDQRIGLDGTSLEGTIRRLVRDELNGNLGETATRNLRQMIRREVQAALALEAAARSD